MAYLEHAGVQTERELVRVVLTMWPNVWGIEPQSYVVEAEYALAFRPDPCDVALDMGCGERKPAPDFVGIDWHNGYITDSRGRTHYRCPDIIADVTCLDFELGSVDFITSFHCLEHLDDYRAVLQHWCDLLRVGGRMVTVVPDFRYTFSVKLGTAYDGPEGHRRDYVTHSLIQEVLSIPELFILDVRHVNYQWSVGIATEKMARCACGEFIEPNLHGKHEVEAYYLDLCANCYAAKVPRDT